MNSKIIEDLETSLMRAKHHKEIIDEVYEELKRIKNNWDLSQLQKYEINSVMEKLEDI